MSHLILDETSPGTYPLECCLVEKLPHDILTKGSFFHILGTFSSLSMLHDTLAVKVSCSGQIFN